MKIIEAELERVRREIDRLRVEEALLVKMAARMSGTPEPAREARSRSPSVKPTVLDIMRSVGATGATTAEVDELVRAKIPSVAKDTVGSILSRLKADGALVYIGDRYFERQQAPKQDPSPASERALRAVK
jgi:hypothetical protein